MYLILFKRGINPWTKLKQNFRHNCKSTRQVHNTFTCNCKVSRNSRTDGSKKLYPPHLVAWDITRGPKYNLFLSVENISYGRYCIASSLLPYNALCISSKTFKVKCRSEIKQISAKTTHVRIPWPFTCRTRYLNRNGLWDETKKTEVPCRKAGEARLNNWLV